MKEENIYLQVRVPVVNIDLAYPEEQWQEIKSTSGDGHVSTKYHHSPFSSLLQSLFFSKTENPQGLHFPKRGVGGNNSQIAKNKH